MNRPFIAVVLVVGLLLCNNPGQVCAQSLIETVKSGNLRLVKKLLTKKSVAVNELDSEGLTSLMMATIANDSMMVVTLLMAGADPNIKTKSGMTVLHAAAFNNRDLLMPMIIAAGADPNKSDNKGRTPLIIASQMGNTNPISILIEAGAQIEFRDSKSNTAVMLACANRHLGALNELLEKGANPNARDLQGRTPLMLLSVLGEDEMIRILLKHKADTTLVDFSMKSALAYAREYRRTEVTQLLEKAGAKY